MIGPAEVIVIISPFAIIAAVIYWSVHYARHGTRDHDQNGEGK